MVCLPKSKAQTNRPNNQNNNPQQRSMGSVQLGSLAPMMLLYQDGVNVSRIAWGPGVGLSLRNLPGRAWYFSGH